MQKYKVCIVDFRVCERRLIDLKNIQGYLISNGHTLVADPVDSDFLIYYPCAFNKFTELESIDRLKPLLELEKRVVLSGCLPLISDLKGSDLDLYDVVPHRSYGEFDEFFFTNYRYCDFKDSNYMYDDFFYKLSTQPIATRSYSRFTIRVSSGCLGMCTYCVDKKANGPLKSKLLSDCVSEYKKAIRLNEREVFILADDVSAYGLDIGESFSTLLKAFLEIDSHILISCGELNPKHLVYGAENLFRSLTTHKPRVSEITLACQSGSSRILSAMNRGYDRQDLLRVIHLLSPVRNLRCHFIVGFPSETTDDLNETLSLLRNFSSGTIFLFSFRHEAPVYGLYKEDDLKEQKMLWSLTIDFLQKENFAIKVLDDKIQFVKKHEC